MRQSTPWHAIWLWVAWCMPEVLAMEGVSSNAANAANALLSSLSVTRASGPISGVPTDLVAARSSVLAGSCALKALDNSRIQCPGLCSSLGLNNSDWTGFHTIRQFRDCKETMLLDFSLSDTIGDTTEVVKISACVADLKSTKSVYSEPGRRGILCGGKEVQRVETKASVEFASSGLMASATTKDIILALDQLRAFSTLQNSSTCDETIKYAYSSRIAVGVYAGSGLSQQGVLTTVLDKVITQIQSGSGMSETMLAEVCNNSSARYTAGVFVDTKGQLSSVQNAVVSWKNGTCIGSRVESHAVLDTVSYLAPSNLLQNNGTTSNSTRTPKLVSRGSHCRTVQAQGGDSRGSLASECGISVDDFTKFNSGADFRAKPSRGQHVCCSEGTLPDFTPGPDANGNCFSHLIKSGDSCSDLAAAYGIASNDLIEQYNKNTWGWYGCGKIFIGYNMCLSPGYPPMPASVANTACGPQVPGTVTVPPGTDLTTLNQCPLNACCNIWGQCGTTEDFCTISNSTTGAPGTAAPGQNGCISNCGTNIVSSGAPSKTFRIAYFEAFDWQRPCLHMSVSDIDTSAYSHIHFSFLTINNDFSINTTSVDSQLPLLRGMEGIKRIVSIGGWAFSTDPGTYTIFRNAVASESNRQTLISNLIKFLEDNNLDGVDWDWEYPDEPDIPGIPAGTKQDSTGLFLLLDELKQKMPTGKSVSITAPASYWYLKHFPIQALTLVVDYIVLMTYDLHGQWDYHQKFGSPGCGSFDQGLGNCLRSHINITETINALSMITKAGVPSNMITVGVSSYGRSFQMTTPGCWTSQCTYTGPDSGAYPGRCTGTAGYISDSEIEEIVSQNPTVQKHFDESSQSNIVVFNGTQWVAYMDQTTKATRKALYPLLGFLGWADWAVDLQSDGEQGNSNSSIGNIYIDPGIWNSVAPKIVAPPGATLIWPPKPLPNPTTISFPSWVTTVSFSSLTTITTTLSGGQISTQKSYYGISWLTTLTIPPVTTSAIPVWAITLDSSATTGTIILTSSVQPPPFTVTVTPVISGTTSIIDATQTTTSSGGVVVWGHRTYTRPDETETIGGHTIIIGGITLPPTVVTVTPNPHPTTTPTATDPIINSKVPSWISGTGPSVSPTATPGCLGCGQPCRHWCDPNCPDCPPDAFPPEERGDKSSSSTTKDPTRAVHTVIAETMDDDVFPTGFEDRNALLSLSAAEASEMRSMFGAPTTSSTTTSVHIPDPEPTAYAECRFEDDVFFWGFTITGRGWVTDHGDKLHNQESGCGALTGWEWTDNQGNGEFKAKFNLPFFMKEGCVERAIASAAGPKISCHGVLSYYRLGSDGARETSHPRYSDEQIQSFASFYAPNTTYQPYTPLDWATVVPTWVPVM